MQEQNRNQRSAASAPGGEYRGSRKPRRRFRFEKIESWQRARAFNQLVYEATKKFPKAEIFGLTSQVRRASVSVSSNIAEGSGRNSDVDFAHFLEIAYALLMETCSQLFLAIDQKYIAEEDSELLFNEADALVGMIVALSKSLGRESRISTDTSPNRH